LLLTEKYHILSQSINQPAYLMPLELKLALRNIALLNAETIIRNYNVTIVFNLSNVLHAQDL